MAKKRAPLDHLPSYVEPMAAQLVTVLPEGSEWIYELKLDGFRALLIKNGTDIQLRSRKDKDLARAYPAVAAAGRAIQANQALLDGEIVVLDQNGRPSLHSMQSRGKQAGHQIVFYVFDVLHVDGRDVAGQPLHQRRTELPGLVSGNVLRISQALPGTAVQIVAAARAMGLEGVMAKHRDSLYLPGDRSGAWLKLKLQQQQEFVVGGFRPDGEASIDALVLGYYEGAWPGDEIGP